MSKLDDFNPDERKQVVSLPYLVGVWLSHAEDEDGDLDDIKELAALEDFIKSISRRSGIPEFVQDIAKEIGIYKNQWSAWHESHIDIHKSCHEVFTLLEKYKVSEKDARSYKVFLYKTAEAVARAHGEFGEEEGLQGFFAKIADTLEDLMTGDRKNEDFMNIAPSEEAALNELKKILSTL